MRRGTVRSERAPKPRCTTEGYGAAGDGGLEHEQPLTVHRAGVRSRSVTGGTLERGEAMPCQHCGEEFDPIRHRWLCPHCKTKNTCCE